MRFHLARSVFFTAFVTDVDTAVLVLSGSSAPDRAGHSGRWRIRTARAGGACPGLG